MSSACVTVRDPDLRMQSRGFKTCPDGTRIRTNKICPTPAPAPVPAPVPVEPTPTPINPTPLPDPTPAPPPTPTPNPVVSPIPIGLTNIADNFDTNLGIELTHYGTAINGTTVANRGGLPPESPDPNGSFRILCVAGHLNRDDAIVFPGVKDATHLHQYWGNTGTNNASTYDSLRQSGSSTCGMPSNPNAVNRTAYWMPAMLDGEGNAVKPDFIQNYYKIVPNNHVQCTSYGNICVPLPNGLRFLYGYDMKTRTGGITDTNSVFYWMHNYSCLDATETAIVRAPDNGQFKTIDDVVKAGCPAGAQLRIGFVAPNCWNGQVDSPDRRSHLAWAQRPHPAGYQCPETHPYMIPNWAGHVNYTTDAAFVAGKWHLSSDAHAAHLNGGVRVPAGSTLHFDYFEAWSQPIKDRWNKGCIQAHKSCNNGDMGDGYQVLSPPYPRPPGGKVPLSTIDPNSTKAFMPRGH